MNSYITFPSVTDANTKPFKVREADKMQTASGLNSISPGECLTQANLDVLLSESKSARQSIINAETEFFAVPNPGLA